jgi:cysteine desulfurase
MNSMAPSQPIYLDGFASTPLAPEARAAMLRLWERPGNASSPHLGGALAAEAVATGRAAIAALIGAAAQEIVFTSGATEANNLAVLGVARQAMAEGTARRRVVVSAIEHTSVLQAAAALASEGFEIVRAPVTALGVIDVDALREQLDERVLLTCVMAANNETGVLQPIKPVADLAHGVGAVVHCDAAQAAGKIPLDVADLDIDYLSVSAHKLYGPQGIGALYVAAHAPRPKPLLFGGGHQQTLRPGTEPAALIAGFGAAAEAARRSLATEPGRARDLAHRLIDGLIQRQVRFTEVSSAEKLPGAISLRLHGSNAEDIVERLASKICLSTGSACHSGQVEPSHVLLEMGIEEHDARQIIRAYCGRFNTEAEIDAAAAGIAESIRRSALAPW